MNRTNIELLLLFLVIISLSILGIFTVRTVTYLDRIKRLEVKNNECFNYASQIYFSRSANDYARYRSELKNQGYSDSQIEEKIYLLLNQENSNFHSDYRECFDR